MIKNKILNFERPLLSFIPCDNFIYCTHLHVLHKMSSAMLRFRFASQLCLLCIMIPIPKEKKCSFSNSDHYRIIAVTSILYKISDDLVIPKLTNHVNKQSHSLITITHQFGFKFN